MDTVPEDPHDQKPSFSDCCLLFCFIALLIILSPLVIPFSVIQTLRYRIALFRHPKNAYYFSCAWGSGKKLKQSICALLADEAKKNWSHKWCDRTEILDILRNEYTYANLSRTELTTPLLRLTQMDRISRKKNPLHIADDYTTEYFLYAKGIDKGYRKKNFWWNLPHLTQRT